MTLRLKLNNKQITITNGKRWLLICLLLICGIVLTLYAKGEIEHYRVTTAHQPISKLTTYPALYHDTMLAQVRGKSIAMDANFQDPRAYILDSYFKMHDSPLYGTGELFVKACDHFGAPKDCTTVAAIAHAETNLCKYHTSAEYFNCWGFGGGGEHRMYFNSWDESIGLVTDRLVNSYGIRYMIDPSLMETVFCGDEPGCTNWGNRVKFFMNQISEYARTLGFNYSLFDLR